MLELLVIKLLSLSIQVPMMELTLDNAIEMIDIAFMANEGRHLKDIEIVILRGTWNKEKYDEIAAKEQYSIYYIRQDVAPKLWICLSKIFGEKVKRNTFRGALERYYKRQINLGESETYSWRDRQNTSAKNLNPQENQEFTRNVSGYIDKYAIPDIYIKRDPIELTVYNKLQEKGALVRLKAPKYMGKTSLSYHVLSRLESEGIRTAYLSFELADRSTHLRDLDKFLRWFCNNISRELGLKSNLDEYWDVENMGSKVSCTTYLEDYLLASDDRPLVLCLDDVDLLFPFPEIYEDFFLLLRSWYEKARSRPLWKQLRQVIVHATDVYIKVNYAQSPFNVGLPIELSEFSDEQVLEFAKQYGLDLQSNQFEDQGIQPLIEMVGGHPYLLEQAFEYLKNNPDLMLTQLMEMVAAETGIYGHHLRKHFLNLKQNQELAATFKQLLLADRPSELNSMHAYQLYSMGLVTLSGDRAFPRCRLYNLYFKNRLVDS